MGAIHSMTGYAACSTTLPGATLHLELRSVNSRFLDLHFRLPDELRASEPALRELLAARLARGKVDCRASVTPNVQAVRGSLNGSAVDALRELEAAVRREFPDARPLGTSDVLRWPGVLGDSGPDYDACLGAMRELGGRAVAELVATRAREGAQLTAMLRERLTAMRAIIAALEPKVPAAHAAFEARVRQRLLDALGSADDERVRQEIVVFATRVDVTEEVSRLRAHIDETERVLTAGGAAGKRLDFLMQEFNREANTLGSKSVSGEISADAMELKLLIEQMREQVQNIE